MNEFVIGPHSVEHFRDAGFPVRATGLGYSVDLGVSPGWAWELPDDSGDSSRWYRTPGTIVDEYEVEVQNPESLVALGEALGARAWPKYGEPLPGTGRPLNRAGRRAQRRRLR